MKILNTLAEDYHIHSLNFSDGFNTIDEIVQYAHKIGLEKIVITDHSQATLDDAKIPRTSGRGGVYQRKNMYNDVEVLFGVEGDLLNEEGDCCFDIQGIEGEFLLLSCHLSVFKGNQNNMTQAYIKAIEKYHEKIDCIGHLCKYGAAQYLDVKKIVEVANRYQIPIEFNCANFVHKKTDLEKLKDVLDIANQIYVNSDAHTLAALHNREAGFDYLKEQGLIH